MYAVGFSETSVYMPNYTASRCTKPYFNIHSRDIIVCHNGNHCPVLPVLFLCLFLPWLVLPSYIQGRYLLCQAWGFWVLTLILRVAGPLYRRLVSRVLYQRGVHWFYCSKEPLCGCSSSAFYHWLPLLPLFAGCFKCHFERALIFPMGRIVYVYYHLCRMTHLFDGWYLLSRALLGYPLFVVLCDAMFTLVDVKSLDVILSVLFLGTNLIHAANFATSITC